MSRVMQDHLRRAPQPLRPLEPERSLDPAGNVVAGPGTPAGPGGDFLHTLAHDVRNSVTAIQLSLEHMRAGRSGPLTEEQAAILASTTEACELVQCMTSDILDLWRFESGKARLVRAPMDLLDTIAGAVRLSHGSRLDKAIEVATVLNCRTAKVVGDRGRLVRVMLNLLLNAIEHSPPGGRLVVTCHESPAGEVITGVEDEGPGIPSGQQARVFERGYRGPQTALSRPGGLGLGLHYCRITVEAHGGRIWIESPVPGRGRGTRLAFSLPVILPGREA